MRAGNTLEVSIEDLVPGDRILVKSGEKIPLDGRIFEGTSTVDESMLTGESVPVEKQPGMQAIGGSINGSGVLKMAVEKVGGETYLAQVIQLVQDAQQQKSKTQGLADKAAKWLFYIAVVTGILTFAYWLFAAGPGVCAGTDGHRIGHRLSARTRLGGSARECCFDLHCRQKRLVDPQPESI